MPYDGIMILFGNRFKTIAMQEPDKYHKLHNMLKPLLLLRRLSQRISLAMDGRYKHYVWGGDTECRPHTGNINSNIDNFIYRRCVKPEI